MARSADLNRKSSSGSSYARAAKKFGTTPEVVKAYAQQVREFNRQQRQAAKAWGYKGDYYKAPSLSQLARDQSAANRFGNAPNLFKFASESVSSKLADNVQETWKQKAEQYVANIKQALTNTPESAFPESKISQALLKMEGMTDLQVMRATGGEFLQYWYHGDPDDSRIIEHNDLVDLILGYRGRKHGRVGGGF